MKVKCLPHLSGSNSVHHGDVFNYEAQIDLNKRKCSRGANMVTLRNAFSKYTKQAVIQNIDKVDRSRLEPCFIHLIPLVAFTLYFRIWW